MAITFNADTTNGAVITSDTSGEIELQANGVTKAKVTANGLQDANGNSLRGGSYRNLIINGDMKIAQRGTSASGLTNGSTGYHTVDRFQFVESGSPTSAWTMSQDTDVPTGQGFANSLKMDCTTAQASLGTGDTLYLFHKIEGQNLQYLKFGTSSAESLTLSFWVKSNKTGTYIAELYQTDATRAVSYAYTVSSANTWEKKTITYVGDTSGQIDNDNDTGLQIAFWLATGTDRSSGTLATSWASVNNPDRGVGQVNLADSTSNYINITGLQLEVGEGASNFEFLPYDVQLQRCQRYYEETDPDGRVGLHGYIKQTNTKGRVFWNWKVKKRSAPTLSVGFVTAGLFTLRYGDAGTRNCSNSQVTLGLSTIDCCTMDIEIAETMLSGYGLTCDVRGDLSGNTRLIADAEL